MPSICLSMIVRNEAPVIVRCLDSVLPIIDAWAIVDTGSDDGTQEIVRDYFVRAGLPGELRERPWRDFASNRNEALELSRLRADYSLVIDADDTLEIAAEFDKAALSADGYSIAIDDPPLSYARTQLVRNALPWSYRGVLHEFLTCDGAGPTLALGHVLMRRNHDGARRRDPDTYRRDAELLEQALLTETDPHMRMRYTYYLGQSYKDANEPAKAAEAYGRRAGLDGWDEERWSAVLQQARCLLLAGDEAGFVRTAARAYTLRPQRAEPLIDLAAHLRAKKDFAQAMTLAKLASQTPRPDDRLFVEEHAYTYGPRQELSVSGYYSADEADRELGRAATNALAIDRDVPETVRDLARHNLSFYAKLAVELFPSWNCERIGWTPPVRWSAMNPTIVRSQSNYVGVLRTVNFIPGEADYRTFDGGVVRTRNYLARFDERLRPSSVVEIGQPHGLPEPLFPFVLGFEDMRLVEWNGKFWASSTMRELDAQGLNQIVLVRIDTADPGAPSLTDWRVMPCPHPMRHQKNWMPRVNDGRLEFIYSVDPTIILDDTGKVVRQTVPDGALDHLRGGSQAIPFDGGWLAVTHEVTLVEEKRAYMHRFVWWDADDVVQKLTEPFIFIARGLEFAAGLCWHADGERLIVSFGARDAEAWLGTVRADDVREAMRTEP